MTGLRFEAKVQLAKVLASTPGYAIKAEKIRRPSGKKVEATRVYFQGEPIGLALHKKRLYSVLLEPRGVKGEEILSKLLLPDDALWLEKEQRLIVIEKKFQKTAGSVDEKLQTCDFKLRQYQRLAKAIGGTAEYYYVLERSWFDKPAYADVYAYAREKGCDVFFDEIPLDRLGLPVATRVSVSEHSPSRDPQTTLDVGRRRTKQ